MMHNIKPDSGAKFENVNVPKPIADQYEPSKNKKKPVILAWTVSSRVSNTDFIVWGRVIIFEFCLPETETIGIWV